MERTSTNLKEKWNSTADVMQNNFVESGHPVFRASSALDRGYFKKKGGQFSIHFSGDTSNAELFLRTINSVNQPSIYGAVADWCEELAQQIPVQASSSIEKSIAKMNEQLVRPLTSEDVKTFMKTPETDVQHREIDYVILKRNSKMCRKK